MKNIFETLEKNKFSYEDIKQNSFLSTTISEIIDINVIVGFRGRQEFIPPLIDSFKKAFIYYNTHNGNDKKFCLTFVEHSEKPDSKKIIDNLAYYIWTPGNITEQYSRSFAYNFGVKYSAQAKYYLLHDVDILVKENFFEEVFTNLKNSKCMQTYGKRRVLYMTDEVTKKVISKEFDINAFTENTKGINLPMFNGQPALGSKGGSILVERDFYYEIGGFDPELFWGYAAEDQIFWDKAITLLGEVDYADSPPIDMFHMWHPPSSGTNPLLYEMENYMLQFRGMKKKERMAFLQEKKKLLTNG